jgi:hypothetical protein
MISLKGSRIKFYRTTAVPARLYGCDVGDNRKCKGTTIVSEIKFLGLVDMVTITSSDKLQKEHGIER